MATTSHCSQNAIAHLLPDPVVDREARVHSLSAGMCAFLEHLLLPFLPAQVYQLGQNSLYETLLSTFSFILNSDAQLVKQEELQCGR